MAGSNSGSGENVGVGINALNANTSGAFNTAVGGYCMNLNTTGVYNAAYGDGSLTANTTGSYNTSVGTQALRNNTTASNNTAVGYQAGYSNTTGGFAALLGTQAGYSFNGANSNVMIGYQAGYSTTGNNNLFVGTQSGTSVTTGTKNTIIGGFSGNQGGLDIRTASNYIVLSDGDGNPRGIFDGSGNFLVGRTANTRGSKLEITGSNGISLDFNQSGGTGYEARYTPTSGTAYYGYWIYNGSVVGSITSTGSGTLYNTTSDYRLKTDAIPLKNALLTIEALNPVSFTWIDGRPDDGFLAHELQAVIPNCVTGEKDAVNEDGTPKYQQMDNSGVIPFLVKAIQEQQDLITNLQTRLTKAGL